MTGQPGRSGGRRENTGGKREGAGRPKNAPDVTVSPGRFMPLSQKWKYAERALQYPDEMLDILVAIARDGETDAVRALLPPTRSLIAPWAKRLRISTPLPSATPKSSTAPPRRSGQELINRVRVRSHGIDD